MNKYRDLFNKLDSQHETAYALIRIFLGIALFVRGWILFTNPESIRQLASQDQLYVWYSYITIAHLFGGLLLAVGLYTRLAAIIQIPILFGAVFMVHMQNGLVMGGQALELATLVLFLLVIYALYGSGPYAIKVLFFKSNVKDNQVTLAE